MVTLLGPLLLARALINLDGYALSMIDNKVTNW